MVKLDSKVVQLLGGPDETEVVTIALAWAERGWAVFPLRPNDKTPAIPRAHKKGVKCDGQCGKLGHGARDASRDPEKIRRMFAGRPNANIGGATLGRVVFDFDIHHGAERRDVFPVTREHLSGRGNGNVHLVYLVGGGIAQRIKSGTHVIGAGVDIRAGAGSYVVLPPSNHPETGKPYTVADEAIPEHALTDEDVRAIWSAYDVALPGAASPVASHDLPVGGVRLGGESAVELLSNPPERGSGQTNDWLTKVAGHYAHQYRDRRDLYALHVRLAAAMVDSSYEDTETVLESIWGSEQAKPVPADERQQRIAERVEAKLIEHEAKAQFGRALAELDPAPPFDLGTLEDVLARPEQEQFRIGGLMLADGFTSIVAQRKTGKTTLNLNMADALLTGRDFLGRFPVTPVDGTVAILNYEVSGHQLGLWADKVGVDRKRLILVNLRGRRNPLSHEQDRADLAAKLRSYDVESIFIDPFSRAFYGESQQDNTQVQAFLNDLDVFARAEVGVRDVVLNVHAGWNGNRSRGASALEDHPDSIIWLRKNEDDGDNGPRFLSALGRDVDVDEDQLGFDHSTQRLNLTGLGSRQQAKREQKSNDLEAPILAAVREDPGANTTQIEKRLRGQQTRFQNGDVNRALKAMDEAGMIRREKGQYGAIRNYPAADTLTMPKEVGSDDF
ncbi:AAA family ATPase [Microbacterium paraoxydans]|uniref:AAA domain-containing protein n=1 Tax=Microbacterium paraoxydans TaxID=199592 RepID=A0A1H1PWM2_9MICO|nr:AAA family ATPase [Microbacterium paraoxydans]SDS15585.1 AAA domain-containing protein [Microbacterium paraoxydans]